MSDTIPGKNGGTLTPFNSESGRAAQAKRTAMERKAGLMGAHQALLDNVPDDQLLDSSHTDNERITHALTREQCLSALSGSGVSYSNIMRLLQMDGWKQQQQQEQQQQGGVTLSISTESLLALADRLGALPERLEHEHIHDVTER
jgi:hypothetical protein